MANMESRYTHIYILSLNIGMILSQCTIYQWCDLSYRLSPQDYEYCDVCIYKNVSNPSKFPLSTHDFTNVSFHASYIPTFTSSTFSPTSNVRILRINGSHLRTVDLHSFDGYRLMRQIHFTHNDLKLIERHTYEAVNYLELLNLSHNNISHIDTLALSGLQWLKTIDLSYNALDKLDLGLFNLGVLEYLNLRGNNIQRIIESIPTALIKFDLSENKLKYVGNYFTKMKNLKELHLKGNDIETIGNDAFKNLSNLEVLDLSHGRLSVLEPALFTSQSKLKLLKLSHNAISEIKDGAWKNLPSHLHVDLSYNKLPLKSEYFKDLQRSAHLNLSHNAIRILSKDVFNHTLGLLELNLSDNLIEELPIGFFATQNVLQHLDLSHNSLQFLEVGSFVGLYKLVYLNLGFNKLTTLQPIIFHNLPLLGHLVISGNFLTTFPINDLVDLTHLKFIDIYNNSVNDCNTLSDIIKSFKKVGVTVTIGPDKSPMSIHGIACVNELSTSKSIVLNDLESSVDSNKINEITDLLKDIKELLHVSINKILDSEYVNGQQMDNSLSGLSYAALASTEKENTAIMNTLISGLCIVILCLIVIIVMITYNICGNKFQMRRLPCRESVNIEEESFV